MIKEGLQYGYINLEKNESFNDEIDLKLSYDNRCIGIELQSINDSLISIRFLYSNATTVESNDKSIISSTFMLNSNEEINKINLFENPDKINSTNTIIGIQFHTTNRRKSVIYGSNNGHFYTESFKNFTFAYAKGIQQINTGIEMLQFFWKKQTLVEQHINDTGKYVLV